MSVYTPRHNALGRFQPGKAPDDPSQRLCLGCGTKLAGAQRSTRRWCTVRCRTYAVRRARRLEVIRLRPNCMICGARMPYRDAFQGPGVCYSATTCSAACHTKRNNWFVRGARVAA